jgi:hypothetical protein
MLNKHIRARRIAVLQPEYQTAPAVSSGSGFAVVANRLYGAALEGLHALGDLFLGRGLFVYVGIAAFVMTLKKRRRRLATEIAIDALLIDEEFPTRVLRPFVSYIRHRACEQRV